MRDPQQEGGDHVAGSVRCLQHLPQGHLAKHGRSPLFRETYHVAVIAAPRAPAGKNAIDGGRPLFHATYQVAVIAASHALAGKNAIDGGKPLFRETDQVAVVAPSTATPSGEGFRLLLETK